MPVDKTQLIRLLDAIEQLYIENLAYQTMLRIGKNRPSESAVNSLLEQAKRHPQLLARVRREFQPLRDRLLCDVDFAEVIQEFLRVVPPKKDVN